MNKKLKRSTMEICVDILWILNERNPLTITPLVRRSNTNYPQVKELVALLVEKRLINEEKLGERIFYHLTTLGSSTLKQAQELSEVLPPAFGKL